MDALSEQRREFYERLDKHILTNINKLKRDKYVVTREMQDTALSLLKLKKGLKCNEGARLKFWVHEKFYPGPTGHDLYCKKTHKPVVVKEDLFDVIHNFHCQIGHRKKEGTWKEVCTRHSWVKRDIIDIYITTCKTCCGDVNNANRPKQCTDIEVANNGFMTRLTLSIINMEDMPDKDYKYILIVRDCSTKYSTAWPLKNTDDEVLLCLLQFFGQFGPPKFVHALKTQFPNIMQTLEKLKKCWPCITVLYGSSNHPAFVGVSERACADLQSKLGAWMAQFEDENTGWVNGIGSSIFQMNTAVSQESGRSPFQSVFGTHPTEPDLFWKTVAVRGWTNEEDIPDLMMKMFEQKEKEKAGAQQSGNEAPPVCSAATSSSTQANEESPMEISVVNPMSISVEQYNANDNETEIKTEKDGNETKIKTEKDGNETKIKIEKDGNETKIKIEKDDEERKPFPKFTYMY